MSLASLASWRLSALVVLLAACPAPARTGPPPAMLPEVALPGLDKTAAPLAELARGRPMIVDFFATWCKPCKKSVPGLRALAAEYQHTDLLVVGVSVGDERAEVRAFARDLGIDYPIYLDADFQLADQVGAARVPTLLVVDRRGRIVHRSRELDAATLAAVREVAREPSP